MSKSIKKTLFFLIYLSAIFTLGLDGRSYAASYAYVSNSYDNTVSVVRLSDNSVTTSIEVGTWPYGVAVSPAGDYVYSRRTGAGNGDVAGSRTDHERIRGHRRARVRGVHHVAAGSPP